MHPESGGAVRRRAAIKGSRLRAAGLSRSHRQAIGAHIRSLRLGAGLTQAELGAGLYWRSAVSRIEAGTTTPSLRALHHFATVLGTTPRRVLPPDL